MKSFQPIEKHEILRKLIHLSSIIYPIAYSIFFTKEKMIIITAFICTIIILIDLLRLKYRKLNKIFFHYLQHSLRTREKFNLTGASFFLLGIFLTILLFKKDIAIIALYILIISDTCASIIGITLGRHQICGEKTMEGFIGFLASAIIVSFVSIYFMNLSIFCLICASIGTSIVELSSKTFKINDNLLIPMIFAILYNLCSKIFYV